MEGMTVDRTFGMAAVVFVALAIVGVFMAASPTTITSSPGDVDALRAVGSALLAAGLTAFLITAFASDRSRR